MLTINQIYNLLTFVGNSPLGVIQPIPLPAQPTLANPTAPEATLGNAMPLPPPEAKLPNPLPLEAKLANLPPVEATLAKPPPATAFEKPLAELASTNLPPKPLGDPKPILGRPSPI